MEGYFHRRDAEIPQSSTEIFGKVFFLFSFSAQTLRFLCASAVNPFDGAIVSASIKPSSILDAATLLPCSIRV